MDRKKLKQVWIGVAVVAAFCLGAWILSNSGKAGQGQTGAGKFLHNRSLQRSQANPGY